MKSNMSAESSKTLLELGQYVHISIQPPDLKAQESDDQEQWSDVPEEGFLTKRYLRFVPKEPA